MSIFNFSTSSKSKGSGKAVFNHKSFKLVENNYIVRIKGDEAPTYTEQEELLKEASRYIESYIIDQGYIYIPIPDEETEVSTTILATADWETSNKLLIIVHSGAGYPLGIFSRSLVLEQGFAKGSIINYIAKAQTEGYAVMILRPNVNFVEVENSKTKTLNKVPIVGSETPEIHALGVWESIVSKVDTINSIALLGFGSGASLCKDIFLRQMVRTQEIGEPNKIRAFVTVEASQIIDSDDGADLKGIFKTMAVNMECNSAPVGYRLDYLNEKYHGVKTFSLGLPLGMTQETKNANASYSHAIDAVFTYLKLAETAGNTPDDFGKCMAELHKHDYTKAFVKEAPLYNMDFDSSMPSSPTPDTQRIGGFDGNGGTAAPPTARRGSVIDAMKRMLGVSEESVRKYEWEQNTLTATDFEYLKVVGRGAFGKVMQVRKKSDGAIYAMKILKKCEIIERGQVEHTMSEQQILCVITHPYIVSLKYSFQTKEKLYIITDYYNGGSLFFHLRKAKKFTEDRAKFYAAELLSGLAHLHSQQIIYRDLKLENVLMDHLGHIALTDFGLSKQNIDKSGGATTFCGTAEYIAPELLFDRPYGPAVDWWSFGIMLFEMVHGTTPFFTKNRKAMYTSIVKKEVTYPATFTPELVDVLKGLLCKDETLRLGSMAGGATDIMKSSFFATIDFDLLYRRAIPPPFKPDVDGKLDTSYVPSSILQTEAKESFAAAPKKGKNNPDFGGFTFDPDKQT